MKILCQSILFMCALCCWNQNAPAQVLHAILAGDTSPSAGWGKYTSAVALDLTFLSAAIVENVPESRTNLVRIEMDQDEYCTSRNLLEAIAELKVKPKDTILFYFTGHGSVDDRGQYLALAKDKLYRQDLLAALKAKNVRLVSLITDCCNTRSDGYSYAAPNIVFESPTAPTPLFKRLFFDSEGIVDIISCSPGESAFFLPYQEDPPGSPGSIFTTALLDWMRSEKKRSRSWEDLVRAVSLKVHNDFQISYPKGASIAKGRPVQKQQNIFPYQYPGMPSSEGPRTGVVVRDFSGRGAVITEVSPNSPATQVFFIKRNQFISLQPQQVIVSINGKLTPDTKSVVQEVNASAQIMRLSIRDSKLGTVDVLLRKKY